MNFWLLEQKQYNIENLAVSGAQQGHCKNSPQPWVRAMPNTCAVLLKTQTQDFLGLLLF